MSKMGPSVPSIPVSPETAPLLITAQREQLSNTDCACADCSFTLSAPAPEEALHPYRQTQEIFTCDLPNGFRALLSPFAAEGPSVVNARGWRRWKHFAAPHALTDPFDRQLAAAWLLQPIGQTVVPQVQPPETLTAWLHITNACNLACPYCYVRKSSAQMTLAVGLRALSALFTTAARNGFRAVKLKYAGGEATLHFDLVRQLHEAAQGWSDRTGIELHAVLLTNGTHMTRADVDWCRTQGVELMISLDGVGQLHDQLRAHTSGAGTFARIEKLVDSLLTPGMLRPDITMTVTQANASGVAELVRWAIVDRGLPVNLNLYRPAATAGVASGLNLDEQAIVDGIGEAYDLIEQTMPPPALFAGLLDRTQLHGHTHTCGVGSSYVVVKHDGQIAQCQMHLASAQTFTPQSDLIALVAGGPIQSLAVDDRPVCSHCLWRYRCTAGCPLMAYQLTGRWDLPSPYCRIYQALLPRAVRAHARSLMKAHGFLH